MSQETMWACDWCGTKTKTSTLPYPKDWVRVDPELLLGRLGGKQHEGVKLFPKEMVVMTKAPDGGPEKCTHWEGELCAECAQAIVDAVKNAREARIAKRP